MAAHICERLSKTQVDLLPSGALHYKPGQDYCTLDYRLLPALHRILLVPTFLNTLVDTSLYRIIYQQVLVP